MLHKIITDFICQFVHLDQSREILKRGLPLYLANPFLHYVIFCAVYILDIFQSNANHGGNVIQTKVFVVKQFANQLVSIEINVSHFSYLLFVCTIIIHYKTHPVKPQNDIFRIFVTLHKNY